MRHDRDGWAVESARAKGRPLPDWYLAEPELEPSDAYYLRAWSDLSTCRTVESGPIPWWAIQAYARHDGHSADMAEALVIIIRTMDEAYRRWAEDDRRRKSKRNPD